MGHHGWNGDPPRTEERARARILHGAARCIDRAGVAKTTLSDVATEVGVTRQTVYRYFPRLPDLLHAVAESGAADFVERMRLHLDPVREPVAVVTEAIVFCVDELPREPRISALLQAGDGTDTDLFNRGITSPTGVRFAAEFLRDLPVDWHAAQVEDGDFDGLAEIMLRLIGSLVQHPSEPAATPDDLRALVRRWLGPALGGLD